MMEEEYQKNKGKETRKSKTNKQEELQKALTGNEKILSLTFHSDNLEELLASHNSSATEVIYIYIYIYIGLNNGGSSEKNKGIRAERARRKEGIAVVLPILEGDEQFFQHFALGRINFVFHRLWAGSGRPIKCIYTYIMGSYTWVSC